MANGNNTTHIKLPDELHRALKDTAKREQRTMHNLILLALRQWLTANGNRAVRQKEK